MRRGGHPLFVGLVRIDSDGVGLGSVGDTKVQRLSDVPEFDVVATVDLIGLQGNTLFVDVELLTADVGHETR